jgi:hypothetical protein
VLNKVLDGSLKSDKDEAKNRLKDVYQVPLLGIVPCFCDVLKAEGGLIFAQDKPGHPFTKIIEEMTGKIENLS